MEWCNLNERKYFLLSSFKESKNNSEQHSESMHNFLKNFVFFIDIMQFTKTKKQTKKL